MLVFRHVSLDQFYLPLKELNAFHKLVLKLYKNTYIYL